MANTQASSKRASKRPVRLQRQSLAGEEINEPGAYVEIATGSLYRVPLEALRDGIAPFRQKGAARSQFIRVSTDPFIFPLGARMLCAAHDIHPNF